MMNLGNFSKLPLDMRIYIALQMDIPEILLFCKASSSINKSICENKTFWLNKLSKDNNNIPVSVENANLIYKNGNFNWFLYMLLTNPDKPWDWPGLSQNINTTWEIVLANLDKPWNWTFLSRNPNITWEIVLANPDKPWDWHGLSQNPNITWEIVKTNPDKPWDWHGLSQNPNITWEIVKTNPDKPWNWYGLSFKK